MKIKLDENLGSLRVATQLRLAGHDVATVREQGLTSAPDTELIQICREEGRCLITSDRGFGNRLKFNPADYPGIILIRLPPIPELNELSQAVETIIGSLEERDVTGKLWVIRRRQLQEYEPLDEIK